MANGVRLPLYYPGAARSALLRGRVGIIIAIPTVAATLVLAATTPRWSAFGETSTEWFALILGAVLFVFSLLALLQAHLSLRSLPKYGQWLPGIIGVFVWFPVINFVALMCWCLLPAGPLISTTVWCLVLAKVLQRRRAMYLWLALAIIPNLVLVLQMISAGGIVHDEDLARMYLITGAAWQAIHPLALPLAAELRERDLRRLAVICNVCGYSRTGIAPDAACPECGEFHLVPTQPRSPQDIAP